MAGTIPNQATGEKDTDDMATPTSKRTPSPAFQFYPADFFSSRKVDRMSMTERGIYITLMGRYWLDGGLPANPSELATICRMKAKQFERLWTNGPLHQCFEERNGELIQPRLERERKKQYEYSRRQSDRANMRWDSQRNAEVASTGNASLSRSLSRSQSLKEEQKSAEPPSDSSPIVLTFPTLGTGPKTWDLTEARIADWATAYPGLDVLGESRKALEWAKANGFKTAKGMPAFLVGWFNRVVAHGSRVGVPSPPSHRYANWTPRGAAK